MSHFLPQVPASPRSLSGFLSRFATLFSALTAERRPRARSAGSRIPAGTLADRSAAAHRLPAELPSLIGALAMRGAVFGTHGAQVAA